MGIWESLQHSEKQFGPQVAFIEGEITITYTQFLSGVNSFRNHLLRLGIAPKQIVAVRGDNSIDFAVAMYAVMSIRAIALPVYHQLGIDEWNEILEKTGVDAIVFQERAIPASFQGETINVEGRIFGFQKVTHLPKQPNHLLAINSPAFIRFTSGTTGAAKGVLLSEESIEERIQAANKVLSLGKDDTVIWVLPIAFHFVVSIMLYLRFGAKVVLCKSNLPSDLLELAATTQAAFLYLSPLHVKLLAATQKGTLPKSVRTVISTSAGANVEDCKRFQSRFNIAVSQAYGIIELGLPLINIQDALDFPSSVGKVTPGYEVAILDEHLNELGNDAEGKLAIKGCGMFEAYLNPYQDRSRVMQKGWFLTGDIAKRDNQGRFFICGREKSMINLGGLKVFPEEVEAVINQIPGVKIARVFGRTDERGEERLIAEVVLSDSTLNEGQIKQICREHLATYKVPPQITFVQGITETNSGKVKRA